MKHLFFAFGLGCVGVGCMINLPQSVLAQKASREGQPVLSQVRKQEKAPKYTVIDLGTLPGGSYSGANSINRQGQITGWSDTGSTATELLHTKAVLWQNKTIQTLEVPEQHYFPSGLKINDLGQVLIVPEPQAADNSQIDIPVPMYALLWKEGMTTPVKSGSGYGLNNRGEVVGSGNATLLGEMLTARNLIPYDINDDGDIVGACPTEDKKTSHAFLWRKGVLTDLGIPSGLNSSQAQTINARGQVLVWAYTKTGHAQAFLWHAGHFTALCKPEEEDIWAYGLNTQGQVVGSAAGHAFLWVGGTRYDLDTLIPRNSGWQLTEAKSINDHGQIVGTGRIKGQKHAFLLTLLSPTSGVGKAERISSSKTPQKTERNKNW